MSPGLRSGFARVEDIDPPLFDNYIGRKRDVGGVVSLRLGWLLFGLGWVERLGWVWTGGAWRRDLTTVTFLTPWRFGWLWVLVRRETGLRPVGLAGASVRCRNSSRGNVGRREASDGQTVTSRD